MFSGVSYEDALRDGVLLCKLMNKLQPGLITKINTSGGDYKMMDNLNQYVSYKYILISHERISGILLMIVLTLKNDIAINSNNVCESCANYYFIY